ncbi:GNAT family N-acetyltransferase [Neptunomonas japonica]|uniref:GNAT family N-acetyltransferase n=1 Tax=Neptunomonas japonica TaxID=417574 RepID=UPI00040A5B9B|nr:GNAT family N-acetyltransferase [Neptunomonas japonica]
MTYRFDLSKSITDIGSVDWERLAGKSHPFIRYEFLEALESSGAVSVQTGWQPLHLRLFEDDECILILPLYLKNHSYGEYVFDWAWADAYERHGLDYYPKLVTSVPFTPATGPRIATNKPLTEVLPLLSQIIKQVCAERGISSWHGLFFEGEQHQHMKAQNFICRLGTQYHWFNKDYLSFEHFLEGFNSRKRKSIKRERQKIAEQGVTIKCIEGSDITESLLNTFYHCYHLTHLKRGRQGYLTQDFFSNLLQTMPEQIVLFAAQYESKYVATALCFKDSQTLYGRYWGCIEEFHSLHFETCFYTGIEYCMQHGLQRFDPGAQGEHKIQRGFEPIETWSSHYISNPSFKQAIVQFLEEEEALMRTQISELSKGLPFKKR